MQMFDRAEAEYRELSEKKRIVENDKDKIRKVRHFTRKKTTHLQMYALLRCPCTETRTLYDRSYPCELEGRGLQYVLFFQVR